MILMPFIVSVVNVAETNHGNGVGENGLASNKFLKKCFKMILMPFIVCLVNVAESDVGVGHHSGRFQLIK